jgi:TRAP-type C4-dicarboxylate transport system permease small subunit
MTQTGSPPGAGPAVRTLKNPLETLAGLMLVVIVLIVFAGVVFRYFLHIGLGWTEEAARFLLIWMTFVSATVAVRRWAHFQLTLVTTWIPRRLHRSIDVFAILVVLAMAAILVRYGTNIMRVSWNQESPMMGWNMGLLYAVVPMSGALMFLFGLGHLIRVLRGGELPVAGATHGPAAESTSTIATSQE